MKLPTENSSLISKIEPTRYSVVDDFSKSCYAGLVAGFTSAILLSSLTIARSLAEGGSKNKEYSECVIDALGCSAVLGLSATMGFLCMTDSFASQRISVKNRFKLLLNRDSSFESRDDSEIQLV